MKQITALIPARGGSKGVPGKNIRTLCGYPLIAYSIMACKLSKNINRVIVSTDSQKIADIALKFGAEVPFIRPPEFAEDNSTDLQVIQHYFDNSEVKELAYLRPTTPLRDPEILDKNIELFFKNRNLMSGMRSMSEMPEPPYKVFKIENGFCKGFFEDYNGIKDYTNLPRQIFPLAYQPNGYLDISKRETAALGISAFGQKIIPAITEHVTEIDMEYEFKLLEFQLDTLDSKLLDNLKRAYD
tara:strand:- start:12381 stop:13106 length:726 start_codon:yes stop_codon:yes gene_type:complete